MMTNQGGVTPHELCNISGTVQLRISGVRESLKLASGSKKGDERRGMARNRAR